MYWKDIDSDNYDIMISLKGQKYRHLITFTRSYECMPYIQYNNVRYASFDRIKYNYYRGAVLPRIINMCEHIPRNYKCLLKNLLDIEQQLKNKNNSLILSGKFQPFRKECIGGDVNKLIGNLYENFGRNVKLSKQTEIYMDTPKKNFITKIYPAEKDMIINMYRPAEKKTKYYNKLIKIQDRYKVNDPKRIKGKPIFENASSKIKSLKKATYQGKPKATYQGKPKATYQGKPKAKSNRINKSKNNKKVLNSKKKSSRKLTEQQKNILISNMI